RGVFLICGAVLIALAFRHLRWGAAPVPTAWPHRLLYGAILAAYLTLYFFNALAPEISPDGNGYHLPLVARYAREHGFHKLTTNMYASLSQGMEMLFLWAYSFGRGSAAALAHFCFLLALAAAMFLYGRRFLTPAAGACAALFVFCSPIVGIDAISAYNDIAVAAVAVALLYTLRLWEGGRQPALLAAIGLLAGFAFALKYTAGVAIPYAIVWIAWR